MNAGFSFALAAAACWAAVDLLAADASRRIGTAVTVLACSVVGFLASLALLPLLHQSIPTDLSVVARLGLLGTLFGFSYFAIFFALKLGPVAVVSPVLCSYGLIVFVASFMAAGRLPNLTQAMAVPVAAVGTVLCGFVLEPNRRRFHLAGYGPLIALIAVVLSAAFALSLKSAIRGVDWDAALVIIRAPGVVLGAVALVVMRTRQSATGRFGGVLRPHEAYTSSLAMLLRLILIGLLDTTGLGCFLNGLSYLAPWLTVVVAAASPAIVIVGATVIFRERLQWTQWLGAGLVLGSLLLLDVA